MEGFNVKSECDPAKALGNLKVGAHNLAILDIMMYNIDGVGLYDRRRQADKDLKVCFLTAFDVEYYDLFKQRFPDLLTHCFICKPVSIISRINMVEVKLNIA